MRPEPARTSGATRVPLIHEPADEAALVARARAGGLDACNGLVDLYQRQVYNLCLRMLGSPQAAEDATQEAFLSAYRHIGSFRGERFSSWLLRIANNVCIDELRRQRRRTTVPIEGERDGEPVTVDVADPAAGPEELAERSEVRSRIAAGLAELPPEQRAAIVMADVQGFSYEEVADALGCSVGTVKSRIFRGRERLRRFLQSLPEPPHAAVRLTGEGAGSVEQDRR